MYVFITHMGTVRNGCYANTTTNLCMEKEEKISSFKLLVFYLDPGKLFKLSHSDIYSGIAQKIA